MTLREFAKNRLSTLNDWQSQAVAMIDNGEPVVIVNPHQTGVTYFTQLVSRWKAYCTDQKARESMEGCTIERGQIGCNPNDHSLVHATYNSARGLAKYICTKCGWVKAVSADE